VKSTVPNRGIPETAMYNDSVLGCEQMSPDFAHFLRSSETSSLSRQHDLLVRVYKSLEDLSTLVPEWEHLLADCPDASTFSTWEWLSSWWRAFGDDQKLLVLAFHDSNSRLVGLAPLALAAKRVGGMRVQVIRLVGDGSGDSDNLNILVCPGYEVEIIDAFFDFIEKRLHGWDICELNTVPAQSRSAKHLLLELQERDWYHLTHQRPCSVITLPESWEAYQKRLSSKERGKINYRSRHLEKKYCVRFYKCTEASELSLCLEHLYRLHQKRWESQGELGSFRSVARRNFYSDMSHLLLERGRLEFWLLELDGKTVAALFGFRHLNTVYSLQEGFDPSYQADSIGYVLRAHVLGQLIAAGIRRYDFLFGRDPSKARWVAQEGNYLDLHFARPYSLGSCFLRAVECGANTKEWLRARLPRPLWTLLHRLNASVSSR
jgi:CelD/BcsL family acetyltransferase involved in cellulose biosynthesis